MGRGPGLEGVTSAILSFQDVLGDVPPGGESVVLLELVGDVRDIFDSRQLVDALGVIGHRTIRVDSDRHRTHAEEAKGDETESEDCPLDFAHSSHVAQARAGARDEEGCAH